jgi:hypothetical protein
VCLVDTDGVETTGVTLLLRARRLAEEPLLRELLEVSFLVVPGGLWIIEAARNTEALEGEARSADSAVGVCVGVRSSDRVTGRLASDRAFTLAATTCAHAVDVRVTDLAERASLALEVKERFADAASCVAEEAIGAVAIVLTCATGASITDAAAVAVVIGRTGEGASASDTARVRHGGAVAVVAAGRERRARFPREPGRTTLTRATISRGLAFACGARVVEEARRAELARLTLVVAVEVVVAFELGADEAAARRRALDAGVTDVVALDRHAATRACITDLAVVTLAVIGARLTGVVHADVATGALAVDLALEARVVDAAKAGRTLRGGLAGITDSDARILHARLASVTPGGGATTFDTFTSIADLAIRTFIIASTNGDDDDRVWRTCAIITTNLTAFTIITALALDGVCTP